VRTETLRLLAVIGLGLGGMFVAGALFSVLTGDADWFAAIVILPVVLIMYRLYARWIRPVRNAPDRGNRDERDPD
jgi:membrane protein implicated in regulation of membrane protease activity